MRGNGLDAETFLGNFNREENEELDDKSIRSESLRVGTFPNGSFRDRAASKRKRSPGAAKYQ